MKKVILSVAIIVTATLSYAQSAKVVNAFNYMNEGDLKKALAEIEPATTHVKTGVDGKTWFYRGQINERIYFYNEEDKAKYADIKRQSLVDGIESFAKALELGSRRIDMGIVKQSYQRLGAYAYQEGVNGFNEKNFENAAKFFELCYKVKKSENVLDSAAIFNAGIAHLNLKQFEKSREALKKAIDLGYNVENAYINTANSYDQEGNKEMYAQTLADARKALPSSQTLVTAEINIYLESGEYDKALGNLNIAIENDPTNKNLYFARGNILDNQQAAMLDEGKKEEAEATATNALNDYEKAWELDPEFFDAAYSIGALKFNQGAVMLNDANALTDDNAYKSAKAKADAKLKEALPFLEKAHVLKPEDISTMTSLKDLYARTAQMEKYEAMIEKLKN